MGEGDLNVVSAARRPGLPLAVAAIGVALALGSPAGALAAPSGGKLAISPAPNTPDASPGTQISVLGVPRRSIRGVSVTGQSTGPHTGRLLAYSGHRGASFVLDQPLAQGESVSVAIRIRGRKPIDYGFTVATLGTIPGAAQPELHAARQARPLRHRAGSHATEDHGQQDLQEGARPWRRPARPAAVAWRPSREQQHGDDQARRPRRADDRGRRRQPGLVQAADAT